MGYKIYIVLTQSYNLLARLIKIVTKDKYSHVSLSFDEKCTDMYSIGRKYTHYPFIGVYKNESIYKGVFNLNSKAEILIYELNVSKLQYDNIIRLLNEYGNSSKGYNFIGLILAIFNKKINRRKYYCSEFIYNILLDESVNIFPKTNNIVKPMNFTNIVGLNKIYEGNIIEYKLKSNEFLMLDKKISL